MFNENQITFSIIYEIMLLLKICTYFNVKIWYENSNTYYYHIILYYTIVYHYEDN